MQFRTIIYTFCLLAISLLPLSAQRTNLFYVPLDKAGWVAAIPRMKMKDGFWLSKAFSRLDYEESYAILSENWKRFDVLAVRAELMQSLLTPPNLYMQDFDGFGNSSEALPNVSKLNPHLLDLLELCLSNSNSIYF